MVKELDVPIPLKKRLLGLALKWSAEAKTPRKKIEAIVEKLGKRCHYSLEPGPSGNLDPIDYFLFTAKKGHCEYFATVATLMFRCLGFPARYVTGYSVMERNKWGGYFVARDRDAHAWVEVLLPDEGWVTIDATPGNWRDCTAGSTSELQTMFEAGLYRFSRWRTKIGNQVNAFIDKHYRKLLETLGTPLLSLIGLTLSIFVLVLLSRKGRIFLFGWLGKKREKTNNEPLALSQARSGLTALETLLEPHGLDRKTSETPIEYEKRVSRANLPSEILSACSQLVQLFCSTRYGGAPWPEKEAGELLERIKNNQD